MILGSAVVAIGLVAWELLAPAAVLLPGLIQSLSGAR